MYDITFNVRGYELSEAEKDYITSKIAKHEDFLAKATNVHIFIEKHESYKDRTKNIKMEITVAVPKTFIKVETSGSDVKELIDILENTLKRRLARYHDKNHYWEHAEKWQAEEVEQSFAEPELETEDYLNITPKIKAKKSVEDRPMHPAEAIEAMELLGHDFYLFKNLDNDKYTVVYKRKNGGYGMIEPKLN